MRKPKRFLPLVALALLILVAGLVWWVRTSEFVARDACLDSGGRWSEVGRCEFQQPTE
jgi:hypothetical protein